MTKQIPKLTDREADKLIKHLLEAAYDLNIVNKTINRKRCLTVEENKTLQTAYANYNEWYIEIKRRLTQ